MKRYCVWCPDQGEGREDGRTIWARTAGEAAEFWAEADDQESADYSIVRGQDVEVCVLDLESGREDRYRVAGESVAVYCAEEIA